MSAANEDMPYLEGLEDARARVKALVADHGITIVLDALIAEARAMQEDTWYSDEIAPIWHKIEVALNILSSYASQLSLMSGADLTGREKR